MKNYEIYLNELKEKIKKLEILSDNMDETYIVKVNKQFIRGENLRKKYSFSDKTQNEFINFLLYSIEKVIQNTNEDNKMFKLSLLSREDRMVLEDYLQETDIDRTFNIDEIMYCLLVENYINKIQEKKFKVESYKVESDINKIKTAFGKSLDEMKYELKFLNSAITGTLINKKITSLSEDEAKILYASIIEKKYDNEIAVYESQKQRLLLENEDNRIVLVISGPSISEIDEKINKLKLEKENKLNNKSDDIIRKELNSLFGGTDYYIKQKEALDKKRELLEKKIISGEENCINYDSALESEAKQLSYLTSLEKGYIDVSNKYDLMQGVYNSILESTCYKDYVEVYNLYLNISSQFSESERICDEYLKKLNYISQLESKYKNMSFVQKISKNGRDLKNKIEDSEKVRNTFILLNEQHKKLEIEFNMIKKKYFNAADKLRKFIENNDRNLISDSIKLDLRYLREKLDNLLKKYLDEKQRYLIRLSSDGFSSYDELTSQIIEKRTIISDINIARTYNAYGQKNDKMELLLDTMFELLPEQNLSQEEFSKMLTKRK